MENYKSELTSLKEELTSRIDAVIAKIEKPKFEVGKWYNNESNTFLFCYQGETSYGFGNADNYEIDLETASLSPRFYHLATQKEVEEALTKQIEKKFPINTRIDTLDGNTITLGGYSCIFLNNTLYATSSTGDETGILSDILFKDGIFATPIKTKTIDDLAINFDAVSKHGALASKNWKDCFKYYLIKEKQTIIETLNNL